MLNETHDPRHGSWIAAANDARSDFPLQNLPFGVFRRAGGGEAFRCGVAIGDQILDLPSAVASGALESAFARATRAVSPLAVSNFAAAAASVASAGTLNALMQAGAPAWSSLRLALFHALHADAPQRALLAGSLVPQREAEMGLPAHIGDYTDFYTSIHHAMAVGRLFRPDHPLPANYRWLPIAYHGRSSSVGVSAQWFHRPAGQLRDPDTGTVRLGLSRRIDFELELGIFIGTGNALGTPIPIEQAEAHVFGLCLVNDWSARDLQAWETQPLGPFLSKNFATTISPWIVTLEALAPYRLPWHRTSGEPEPLAYLDGPALRAQGALDIELEVALQTRQMREAGLAPEPLARSNFRHCYWSVAQLIAHHSVNGCALRSADLLGSGTQSGPEPGQAGSLLELTRNGREALRLPSGEVRRFLEDGDSVTLRAWCARAGAVRLGFGEARGGVLAALGPGSNP